MTAIHDMGKIPYDRSNNIETSLLLANGRISRGTFLLRVVACAAVWLAFHLLFVLWETPDYYRWVERGGGKIQQGAAQIATRHRAMRHADRLLLPAALLLFLAVQAAKRIHDNDRSAWFLLVPFYNLWLLLSRGTPGDNRFGLLPHRERVAPTYTPPERDDATGPAST